MELFDIKDRGFKKDFLVFVGCFLVIALFLAVLFYSVTLTERDFFRTLLPFEELMYDTVKDLNAILRVAFWSEALNYVSEIDVFEWLYKLTASTFILGMSTLLLANLIKNLIFAIFYRFFLDRNEEIKDAGAFVKGLFSRNYFFYGINYFLLHFIATVFGTFSAGGIIKLVEMAVDSIGNEVAMTCVSATLFIVLYLLCSVSYMMRANTGNGIIENLFSKNSPLKTQGKFIRGKYFISARKSLLRTGFTIVFSEILTMFITNTFLMALIMTGKAHMSVWIMLSMTAILIVWVVVKEVIETLMKKLCDLNLPYCGRFSPISGFLGTVATTCLVVIYYFMFFAFDARGEAVQFVESVPLFAQWKVGVPMVQTLTESFGVHLYELICLLVMSTVASALQYVAASFVGTLVLQTQLYLRPFIWGAIASTMFIIQLVFDYAVPEIVKSTGFLGVIVVLWVFVYVLVVLIQPIIALKGLLTSVCALLVLHFVHTSAFTVNGVIQFDFTHYLGYLAGVFAVLIVFELGQNLLALFEKNANKSLAKMLITDE